MKYAESIMFLRTPYYVGWYRLGYDICSRDICSRSQSLVHLVLVHHSSFTLVHGILVLVHAALVLVHGELISRSQILVHLSFTIHRSLFISRSPLTLVHGFSFTLVHRSRILVHPPYTRADTFLDVRKSEMKSKKVKRCSAARNRQYFFHFFIILNGNLLSSPANA